MNTFTENKTDGLSVVIPVYNEGQAVGEVLKRLEGILKGAGLAYEIVVVNDGSSDNTAEVIKSSAVALTSLTNPVNMGYGFSLKRGIRAARYDRIAIADADGTYPLERIPELAAELDRFDMVVGARTGENFRGSFFKGLSRKLFHLLARYITGNRIPDINSGLRAFKKNLVTKYERHISSGFSFTTTITLIAFLTHRFVKYVPVEYGARQGSKSKVNMFRDTLRSAQILVETLLIYNPTKVFLLFSLLPLAAVAVLMPVILLMILLKGLGAALLLFSYLFFFSLCAALSLQAVGFLAVILSRTRGE